MKKIPKKYIGDSWDNSNSLIKTLYIISWILFVFEVLLFLFFSIREGYLVDGLGYVFYQLKHRELDLITVLEICFYFLVPIVYVIANIVIIKSEKLGIISLILLFILRVTSPVTIMAFLTFIFTYIITY